MSKISTKELEKIITETIYEMLQEKDGGLIELMMESERFNGGDDVTIDDWLEKTTAVIQEQLGIPSEESSTEVITEEMKRVLRLADIKDED